MPTEEYDAVVIGSGPGGGAATWALARRGAKVLLLEAGPAYDYQSDYRLDKPDWESSHFPSREAAEKSYTFSPLQDLEERWSHLRSWNHLTGNTIQADQRFAWAYHHVRGVGGSTLHYQGEAHRLHPESFSLRTRFGSGADWPLEYSELEPYYDLAERIIGVAGPSEVPARWRSSSFPLPPHPLSYASQIATAGFRKLGLTLSQNSLAILSQAYEGRPECNYCANCIRGCPRADKGSVDVTFIAQALRTGNVTLLSNTEVIQLEAGGEDTIESVHFRDEQGQTRMAKGQMVVVACGAVLTSRLLLTSRNRHAPNGVANESGQVGRNFLETLFWTASALYPDRLQSYRGVPIDAICWDYAAPDSIRNIVGGFRLSMGAAQADLLGPIAYATRVVGGFGPGHHAAMKDFFGRTLTVTAVGEFLPNSGTFVDVDPETSDRVGLPLARINSQLTNVDLWRLSFMAEKCRAVLQATGAERIFEEYGSYDTFSSTHVFGTCRMGTDPQESVVDAACRSHRWKNLLITDASVFPSTGSGEAPSLTIEALALRAVELFAI